MKKLVVLFGIATCLVSSLSAQNTPGNERPRAQVVTVKAKTAAKTASPSRQNERVVYYITSVNGTGSHIPLVVRRYKGENTPMFRSEPGKTYTNGGLDTTGALDVKGALLELDPALSSAGH